MRNLKTFGVGLISALFAFACSSDDGTTTTRSTVGYVTQSAATPTPASYTYPTTCAVTLNNGGTLNASAISSVTSGNVCLDAASGTVTLSGPVTIASGVELHVKAGTTVSGAAGTGESNTAVLIIDRGAKIYAVGTASAPIVWTGATQAVGSWGGIVINGYAQYSSTSGTGTGEGGSGTFGGVPEVSLNNTDNSGTITYNVLRYPGTDYTSDNQLNGIAFQAVGSNTVVENVAVLFGKDDGIEMFGGTVNHKNIFIYGAHDDQFDWTSGWVGASQNVVLYHYSESDSDASKDPRGIEGDNNEKAADLVPISNPSLANVTIIGDFTDDMKNIGKVRRGSKARIYNLYLANFKKTETFEFEGAETTASITNGETFIKGLKIEKVGETNDTANSDVIACDSDGDGAACTDAQKTALYGDSVNDNAYSASLSLLDDTNFNGELADFKPSTDVTGYSVSSSDHPNFSSASYIGGVSSSDDWVTSSNWIANVSYGQ